MTLEISLSHGEKQLRVILNLFYVQTRLCLGHRTRRGMPTSAFTLLSQPNK